MAKKIIIVVVLISIVLIPIYFVRKHNYHKFDIEVVNKRISFFELIDRQIIDGNRYFFIVCYDIRGNKIKIKDYPTKYVKINVSEYEYNELDKIAEIKEEQEDYKDFNDRKNFHWGYHFYSKEVIRDFYIVW